MVVDKGSAAKSNVAQNYIAQSSRESPKKEPQESAPWRSPRPKRKDVPKAEANTQTTPVSNFKPPASSKNVPITPLSSSNPNIAPSVSATSGQKESKKVIAQSSVTQSSTEYSAMSSSSHVSSEVFSSSSSMSSHSSSISGVSQSAGKTQTSMKKEESKIPQTTQQVKSEVKSENSSTVISSGSKAKQGLKTQDSIERTLSNENLITTNIPIDKSILSNSTSGGEPVIMAVNVNQQNASPASTSLNSHSSVLTNQSAISSSTSLPISPQQSVPSPSSQSMPAPPAPPFSVPQEPIFITTSHVNQESSMGKLSNSTGNLQTERVVQDNQPLPSPRSTIEMFESTKDSSQFRREGSAARQLVYQQERFAADKSNPEYVPEPVTNRIQKFEKQCSFESEQEKVEKPAPVARPVGPWVKKTSSGLVHQNSWSYDDQNENEFKLEIRRFESSENVTQRRNMEIMENEQDSLTNQFVSELWSDSKPPLSNQPHNVQKKTQQPAENVLIKKQQKEEYEDPPPTLQAQNYSKASFDPWCDPNNPRVIQFQDISAAAFKIKSGILNTPCTKSVMSSSIGAEVFFKKEFNQITGSFKERGARYTLLSLSEEQRKKGVIAASAGNHALALSYHGQDLGVPVTVVMPLVAPIMKVQACKQYGANVIVKGYDIGECKEIALALARENSLLYLNGYDHPYILAGQGTMGLEIVEQVPNIDAVVVPVGGGGLIAGVALAVKSLYPRIKVIGVESERCASFSAAMKSGRPVNVKADSSLADGLAVPCVGVNAFATAKHLIDKVVQVKEEWIAIAILRLVEMEKAVVEGAGATALAALLAGKLPELRGKRVVIPLCGGNIDTTVLGRCLERGLAADGRLVKFTVTVSDRPGGIAELTKLISSLGVSIKDMMHERAWIKSDIFSVEVKVVCETKDYNHFQELKRELEKRYPIIRFPHMNQIAEEK